MASKKDKIQFTIPVLVYATYVNVYISGDSKMLNKWNNLLLGKFGGKEKKFTAQGRSYAIYINEEGFRCADIVLDKKRLSFGLVAHEITHCVNYIMNYVDIPLTEDSEEAYTCLTGYLTDAFYQKIGLEFKL